MWHCLWDQVTGGKKRFWSDMCRLWAGTWKPLHGSTHRCFSFLHYETKIGAASQSGSQNEEDTRANHRVIAVTRTEKCTFVVLSIPPTKSLKWHIYTSSYLWEKRREEGRQREDERKKMFRISMTRNFKGREMVGLLSVTKWMQTRSGW